MSAPNRRAADVVVVGAGHNGLVTAAYDAALLTMHGGHDVLAAPHGSAVLHASVPGEDRTQRIYPDAQHDLLHDRSTERVRADIVEWIAERIAQ